jgi:hypothetical protein
MMKSSDLRFLLFSLFKCISASMSTALESRYGLSFSSTTIVASRFNSTGAIELTTFPASPEYRALYIQVVHHYQVSSHDVDEGDMKSTFEASVGPIIEDLTKQTGHAPEIATLFLPSVFDWKDHIIVSDTIFPDVNYATRVAPARQAACYGYGFLEGRNLGRPIHECNENGPSSLVLFFEYENEYLYAWLVEVEFALGVYYAQQEKICKGCGEEHRKVSLPHDI